MVPAEVCTCGLALRHHKAPGQFCLARELRRKAPRAPFRSWAETVMRPVAPFQFQAATRPMLMAQGEISGLHLEVALERQGRYSLVRHTTQMATEVGRRGICHHASTCVGCHQPGSTSCGAAGEDRFGSFGGLTAARVTRLPSQTALCLPPSFPTAKIIPPARQPSRNSALPERRAHIVNPLLVLRPPKRIKARRCVCDHLVREAKGVEHIKR